MTAPHQTTVVGSAGLAPILGCGSSNQPDLFHTFMFLPFLWAGLRLCILPLPAAEVTDKGTTLCTVTGEWRTCLQSSIFPKSNSSANGRKKSHLMLGRAWELLKCTAFHSLPLHCSCTVAASRAQLGPFAVRSDAMRCPTPLANWARHSFRLHVSNLTQLGNRVRRGRVKNVPDGCSPRTNCLTRRHQHSCW